MDNRKWGNASQQWQSSLLSFGYPVAAAAMGVDIRGIFGRRPLASPAFFLYFLLFLVIKSSGHTLPFKQPQSLLGPLWLVCSRAVLVAAPCSSSLWSWSKCTIFFDSLFAWLLIPPGKVLVGSERAHRYTQIVIDTHTQGHTLTHTLTDTHRVSCYIVDNW